MEIEEDIA